MSRNTSKEKWVLTSFQMPPYTKNQVEKKSYELRISRSELMRQAIDKFLLEHADSDEEREAAELVARQRKERLGLMKPKDGFKTEMQIAGAWSTIKKAKALYTEMEVLGRHHYDLWIRRLRENIESLDDDNPTYMVAERTFLDLIAKLEAERDESFPEEV